MAKSRSTCPSQRRVEQSRLEVRYSPTLAGAMVDALPYLVDYPYGCTEQTLNRFLPTVITQRMLINMGLDLKKIQEKRTNLNAQQIGDDQERADSGNGCDRNPVFDQAEVTRMVKDGVQAAYRNATFRRRLGLVQRLGRTKLSAHDGGRRAWFASRQGKRRGAGARHAGARRSLAQELSRSTGAIAEKRAREAASRRNRTRREADNLDALVYMVLVDAGVKNDDMREFLYRDRTQLAVYSKAMFGLRSHKRTRKSSSI